MDASYAPQGQNPYTTAGNPGAYAGSGSSYGPNPYTSSPPEGAYGNPMDTGGERIPDPGADMSYQQYTEGSNPGGSSSIAKIDPETGIAPRRITDCVCLPIFVVILILMTWVAAWSASSGDPERLKRDFDYRGRLCGVDNDDDKGPAKILGKYTFFCRATSSDTGAVPQALNLYEPICVDSCPGSDASEQYSCLEKQVVTTSTSNEITGPNPPFGIAQNFFAHAEQSVVLTGSYPTTSFQGRYCLPDNNNLKEMVLHGPVNFLVRTKNAVGSFSNCWGILFFTTLFSLLLGLAYVYMFKFCGKLIINISLGITSVILLIVGVCMLAAVPFYFVEDASAWYQDQNPLYLRNGPREATIISGVVGFLVFIAGMFVGGILQHVDSFYSNIQDLVDVSMSCVNSMKEILLWPVIAAFIRLLMMYVLFRNFMYLITMGTIGQRRIVVHGLKYYSVSAVFQSSEISTWYTIPLIIFYLVGSIWIIELCHSFCHFMLSYATILWYYTPMRNGMKEDVDAAPTLHGAWVACRYHLGSIILASFIIPYTRVPRFTEYVLWQNLPTDEDKCPAPFECLSCFGKLFGMCCHPLKSCFDMSDTGAIAKYSKDAFDDIVLRSNHFQDAGKRSLNVLRGHQAVERAVGSVRIVSLVGVVCIGGCGAIFAYLLATSFCYADDTNEACYIQDPIMVAFLAFCVSANIAYSYTMLVDHTSDTLLFCYSWNLRFKRETCSKYVPEDLRAVVGSEDKNPDTFPMYGTAKNSMYLCSWMNTAAAKPPAPPEAQTPAAASSRTGITMGSVRDYRPVSTDDHAAPAMGSYGGYGAQPQQP